MRFAAWVVLLAAAVLLTGCHLPSAATSTDSSVAAAAPGAAGPVVTGRGWTAAGLQGPVPAPGSCHVHHAADGEPLPDPLCTPGAVDRAVTAANVSSTICRTGGYTKSVRPPVSLTGPAKKVIMAAYGISWSQASKYELDHLVELNAGGASDYRNLWPEPNMFDTATPSVFIHNESQWSWSSPPPVMNSKDLVEDELFVLVCDADHLVAATLGVRQATCLWRSPRTVGSGGDDEQEFFRGFGGRVETDVRLHVPSSGEHGHSMRPGHRRGENRVPARRVRPGCCDQVQRFTDVHHNVLPLIPFPGRSEPGPGDREPHRPDADAGEQDQARPAVDDVQQVRRVCFDERVMSSGGQIHLVIFNQHFVPGHGR